jgi:hypothetical protein
MQDESRPSRRELKTELRAIGKDSESFSAGRFFTETGSQHASVLVVITHYST